MNSDSDFQLVKDFLNGDSSAFNKIAIKYRKNIYWLARRMLGNHLDADEVTQEVLITIYKKLNSFKFNSSLFTWIYKITSTRSINFLNRKKLRRFIPFEDAKPDWIVSGDVISDQLENKEKLEKLDRILKMIPVKQRQVFILRQLDGLSYDEISKISGKSIGGLKANYHHAIKKIMEMMNEEE